LESTNDAYLVFNRVEVNSLYIAIFQLFIASKKQKLIEENRRHQ